MLRRSIALLALAGSLSASAADDIPNPDVQFYTKATQGALSEIDAGMMAQHQATSSTLKHFGEMMVKDHTASNQKLRGIAMVKNVDLPVQPNAEQAAKQAGLQTLTGDAFDRAFLEWQILEHKNAIALYKEEAHSGDDADAKLFATQVLPSLESHLATLVAMPNLPVAKDAP